MENPIKMDDLGVPLFLETPIFSFCSQFFQDLDKTLAMAGTFVGTVTYMSPERCLGAWCGGGAGCWSKFVEMCWDVEYSWVVKLFEAGVGSSKTR